MIIKVIRHSIVTALATAIALAIALALAAAVSPAHADASLSAPTLIDGFDDAHAWQPMPSDGVTLALSNEPGNHGKCMRMDVAFAQGGYAIAHRAVKLAIVDNYELAFWVRGEIRSNQLELKLIDTSGENVWWHMEPDYTFPHDWTHVVVRGRKIGFAWGPLGGGPPRDIAAIELVVTAGAGHPGGKGSVWLDDFTMRGLPAHAPIDTAFDTHGELRGVTSTAQHAPGHVGTVTLDLHQWREYGGLTVEWNATDRPKRYDVQASDDGRSWSTLRSVRDASGPRDVMMLPDGGSRWLRLAGTGVAEARAVRVMPPAWGDSREPMLRDMAAHAPRGSFPRWLIPEAVKWAVVGVPGAKDVSLLSTDGALELGRGGPTLESFVIVNRHLFNWANAAPALSEGLPPGVWQHAGDIEWLTVARGAGSQDSSQVVASYIVLNPSGERQHVTLLVALRPFQVNPPWQFLGIPGGLSPIRDIELDGGQVLADQWRVRFDPPPSRSGAWPVSAGLEIGNPPSRDRFSDQPARGPARTHDPEGLGSTVLAWDLDMPARSRKEVHVESPPRAHMHESIESAAWPSPTDLDRSLEALHRQSRIVLPWADLSFIHALDRSVGWIEALRSGPALRPGARAYARSWIRDGALMADALLRTGRSDEARDFAAWFASHQYANGRVPCCVDARGADPVPEHDSHGELIYAIADVTRHTGDFAWARRLMPHVAAAVAYMDSLRAQRLTPEYDSPAMRRYRGLFPPSISHEGYSAKPMHSYWDDLWGLRGYRDAAWLAERTGDATLAAHARDAARQFAHDIMASIESTDAAQHVDYVPGCADLGDFDATSTAIALSPLDVTDVLPPKAFENTLDRYMRFFRARADSGAAWEAFTPYEMRMAGTLARMGRGAEARKLLSWFMQYRDPPEWQQWPEVVWHDTTATKFIGDLPHGWVAAEFCRSVMDLFAFERGRDSSLVIAAGVDPVWLDGNGTQVNRLSTEYGTITYAMRNNANRVNVDLTTFPVLPKGGVVVQIPGAHGGEAVSGASGVTTVAGDGTVTIRAVPAKFSVALRSP